MTFHSVAPDHPLRDAVEAHIRDVYVRQYGAEIPAFPELLVAMVDPTGAPSCAAGLRFGWDNCFSGCYLDEPVEHLLQRMTGRRVGAGAILEVTTLAGAGRGEARGLVERVIGLGRARGMAWGVFTATRRLRLALRRAGFEFAELVPARRERVARPERWGSYYESDPWVCALEDRVATIADDYLPLRDAALPHLACGLYA